MENRRVNIRGNQLEGEFSNPMGKALLHTGLCLLLTFVGFVLSAIFIPVESAIGIANVTSIVLLISMIVLSLTLRGKRMPIAFVYAYATFQGLALYPTVLFYLLDLGVTIVANAFLGTMLWVTLLGIIACKNKERYLSWGKALFIGAIVNIIMGIFLMFTGSTVMDIVFSIFGIVLFSGYVLFDIARLRHFIDMNAIQCTNDLSPHVLSIYLDIIILFTNLLRILSRARD